MVQYYSRHGTILDMVQYYSRHGTVLELCMDLKELRHDILSFFLAMCKITFSLKETTKYWFGKIEKHQRGNYKPKMNKNG